MDMTPESKYLAASNLQGRDVTLVIANVTKEEVGRGNALKPVVYFQGKAKGMVLNIGNTNKVIHMYGPNSDKWIGKSIVVYPSTTDFDGEEVDCVRIRPGQSQVNQAPLADDVTTAGAAAASVVEENSAPDLSDEIPF